MIWGVDYQGGGLFLASTQDVLNGPAGAVPCLAVGLTHGPQGISRVQRYALDFDRVFVFGPKLIGQAAGVYTLEALRRERR